MPSHTWVVFPLHNSTLPGEIWLTMKPFCPVSYLEIYNEQIRDLLVSDGKSNLDLREAEGKVTVSGLSTVAPKSASDIISIIVAANANRAVSATAANAVSSRSHAVLSLNVKQSSRAGGLTDEYAMATLTIVDLAGSERATATKNTGARLNEGANINRSLLALGGCIKALCNPRGGYVPFRDSKLTRLLKHSLSGNCRTVRDRLKNLLSCEFQLKSHCSQLMVVCVSPVHYDDSWNTLQYANRAKEIKTKVSRNTLSVDRHVGQYVETIAHLQRELEQSKKEGIEHWRKDMQASRSRAMAATQESILAVRRACDAECAVASAHASCATCQTLKITAQAWEASISQYIPEAVRAQLHAELQSWDQVDEAETAKATRYSQSFDVVEANHVRRLAQLQADFPEVVHAFTDECRIARLRMELSAEKAKGSCPAVVRVWKVVMLAEHSDSGVSVEATQALRQAQLKLLQAIWEQAHQSNVVHKPIAVAARSYATFGSVLPTIGQHKRKDLAGHQSDSTVKGTGRTGMLPPSVAKKPRKEVAWKDFAGDRLTEEHSSSMVLDQSTTASESCTDISAAPIAEAVKLARHTPRRISEPQVQIAKRASLAKGPLQALLPARRARPSRPDRPSDGTPRKIVSSTSRRVSGIGNIRSPAPIKAQRIITQFDPNTPATPASDLVVPQPRPLLALRPSLAHRASRTTLSFERKMQANAVEAAQRRASAVERSLGSSRNSNANTDRPNLRMQADVSSMTDISVGSLQNL